MSKIQWTEKTWNPVRGCSIVSPGCVNCYAMYMGHRFSGPAMPYEGLTVLKSHGPTWTGKVVCDESKLEDPLHWKKPRRIFVNSMSDLFHEDVPFEFIDKVFAVMALSGQHTFQILTKRPVRMAEYFADSKPLQNGRVTLGFQKFMHLMKLGAAVWPGWPLPNVWLGVSVENQKYADERIPLLLQTPAAVRWVSYEPALGPVNFEELPSASGIGRYLNALSNAGVDPGALIPAKIDWIVYGGESGSGARLNDLEWARDTRDQCKAAGVAFFMKQAGANVFDSSRTESGKSETVWLKDRKGGEMAEWPEDLRVREYPK